MQIQGRIHKDGKFWLAAIPIADLETQAFSKEEALKMAKSVIEDMVDHKSFSVKVTPFHGNDFLISTTKEDDAKLLFALILRRNREKANLTMKEVAERMGASSVNAYARYEQGKTQPSIEKLFEILHAIDKESEPVLTLLIS